MSANRSSAVMQQRHEAHDSLDDYPTPPWATRALCEWLHYELGAQIARKSVREPAANRGHMVKPLFEYFGAVLPSDVHDYGFGYPVKDYLFPSALDATDWTITNPPFRLAEQFIQRALELSNDGLAMIVRSAFLESVGRYNDLYSRNPPSYVLQFSERVVMHKGKLSEKGSTATAYSWLVWLKGDEGGADTRLRWIPPCRKQLEKASDYEVAA